MKFGHKVIYNLELNFVADCKVQSNMQLWRYQKQGIHAENMSQVRVLSLEINSNWTKQMGFSLM